MSAGGSHPMTGVMVCAGGTPTPVMTTSASAGVTLRSAVASSARY
jgi:hypothetical protein